MKIIGSVKEDLALEKRVSITPETVKKLVDLNFSVFLEKKYGEHLGFTDSDYKDLGVEISTNKSEVLNSADIVIQLGLLPLKFYPYCF